MSKKVITGVDGSDSAARAARRAAELAEALGAELVVVTAYAQFEMEKIASGSDQFIFSTEASADATAAGVVSELRSQFPGVAISSASGEGKPGEVLVAAAEQTGADLIVVGNKRVQGIARVLGSIARDVATRAPCDVYVAHTHQR